MKPLSAPHILIVDDEPFNIEIIREHLSELPCRTSFARDGKEAWDLLDATPNDFDVILLDRMMPQMNGMEVLHKITAHPILKHCPVIMLTAMVETTDVLEGIEAGAFYYLTKPFDGEMLVSITNSALKDRKRFVSIQSDLDKGLRPLQNMNKAEFSFKTLQEAHDIGSLIAHSCLEAQNVVLGLTEILINAVEHGNLGISYDEKTVLNNEGRWLQEVESRLQQNQYKDKQVQLLFYRDETGCHITVKDEGQGFEWQNYLTISPERVADNHGRGIAMAVMLGFTKVEYKGSGSEVYLFLEA